MKRELLGLAMCATLAAGCGEPTVAHPDTVITAEDMFNTSQVVQVELDGSNFLNVIDPNSELGKRLISNIALVDHQYPNGAIDRNAPVVNNVPMRVDMKVALHGEGAELSDDAACDTFRVEGEPKYIGAVALGGEKNGVMISWPETTPGFVYLCPFQQYGPQENGVIIFTSDTPR